MTGVLGKYVIYYHKTDPLEFGVLSMFFSGILGMFTIVIILKNNIAFVIPEEESQTFTLIRIAFSGIFSVTGYLAYFKATSKGSVEVTQLFSNMNSVVQLIEEFLFLNIIPDLFS